MDMCWSLNWFWGLTRLFFGRGLTKLALVMLC